MSVATLNPLLLASPLSQPKLGYVPDYSHWPNYPLMSPNYDSPFYGLPLEILQHIASFLPFHALVKVYKCLPKIHRPIFQQQLDHALALMMLTLDIKQEHDKSIHSLTTSYSSEKVLHTRWRVTNFDLENMRVEFQLEEKLGLMMAERRRQELALQQATYTSSPSSLANGIESVAFVSTGISTEQCALQENIENFIWRSRSKRECAKKRAAAGYSTTLVDESDASFPDSNYFHCNRSGSSPALTSATVSFEAHRNVPAPWISQRVEHPGRANSLVDSNAFLTTTSNSKSAQVQRAQERIAAFQQNRVLLRSLARMGGRQGSGLVQFLPTTISLDTRELGQKKAKAILTKPTLIRPILDANGSAIPSSSSSSSSCSSSTLKVEEQPSEWRRHSWHMSGDSAVSFHSGFKQENAKLSTVFKRLLKRSSWNSVGPATLNNSESTDYKDMTRSMDGFRSTDWTSIISGMASSISLPFRRGSQPSSSGGDETKNAQRKDRIVVKTCSTELKSKDGNTEEEEACYESEDSKELFEFTYDIRHDYVISDQMSMGSQDEVEEH
ncbi:hypothetical protein BGZ46_009021 [Entomortierella lignicola]|nr:hypothetical protein BGZ46_009021 [Entomortierella lignicola]